MSRLWRLLLGVVFLAGCRNSVPMQNPFFGPTTVPPPPTGNSAAPMASPYYQGAPGAAPSITPGAQIPSATLGPPPASYPPAGAAYPPQSATERTKAVSPGLRQQVLGGTALSRGRWTTPAVAARPIIDPAASAVNGERTEPVMQDTPSVQTVASVPEWSVVRVAEKQTVDVPEEVLVNTGDEIPVEENDPAASKYATPEPARFQPANGVVEIGQLPPARTSKVTNASYTAPQGNPRSRSIYAVAQQKSPSTNADQAASDSVFGYDPQYRWLKGRLEYSEIERRWKLRYIPIDGATDDNGGSVVLREGTDLGDLRPGDYVTLYGEVGEREASSKGYAPVYHADRIEPVER
jgi:hypothetical protein